MSLLQEVIEQYGDFENPKVLTDKTDKTSKMPKTSQIGGSVSSGSEWSELLENKNGELAEHEIPAAIDMVTITEMRERGVVPDHYTAITECMNCGTVPIFPGLPPEVLGCPWCFNRIKGLPIPSVRE
jgi:hypothetical protein